MTDEEKKKIPDYPELEAGNHVAQTEAQIAEAQRSAELLEKRAKRDRDMAIFGDMANLVAKGAAMHGGAWKINNDELQSAKANERLRALQQKNAAQMAEYAKMRVAAKDNERKERNAMKKAQYDADVEAYKRAVEAEKYAKEQERKDRQDARQTAESTAKINYYNNGGRRTAGGGSSVNRDVYLVNDDGTKKVFRHAENANNIQAAYAELPSGYRVQKEVKLYDEDDFGRPVLRIDAEGMPVTKLVENTKPTLGEMRQAIEEYNAREVNAASVNNTPPSRRKDNSNTPPSRR